MHDWGRAHAGAESDLHEMHGMGARQSCDKCWRRENEKRGLRVERTGFRYDLRDVGVHDRCRRGWRRGNLIEDRDGCGYERYTAHTAKRTRGATAMCMCLCVCDDGQT